MKTSIEIAFHPLNAIEVVSQSPPAIEIHQQVATSLVVELATIGPKGEKGATGVGIQGPPGPSTIGGFGIQITALSVGDQLRFAGNNWENTSQTSLTDGGNF